MGIQDRDYNRAGDFGEGGGFRRAFRRMFVEGDNFFGWSFPLFTVPDWFPGIRGIHVRVHFLYILIAAGELIGSLRHDSLGFPFAAAMMATLFVMVLLHEFGHCLACRWVGGEADQVLMWPLGGLAFCRPPMRWKPALITTLGGPAVNVLLLPILGGVLIAIGASWREVVFFNPFDPRIALAGAWFDNYGRVWLWSAYYVNLILLAFNMLLPMFPMDCGRVVQELLWAKLGYKKSMTIAVNLGLVVAVGLGVFAIMFQQSRLIGIALFGGITCFNERQRLAMLEDQPAWAYDTDKGRKGFGSDPATAAQEKAYKAALKRQQKEQESQREVDRILDKIRDRGMQSLTGREKSILKDATERGKGRN